MTVAGHNETPVKMWANSADSHFIEPADLWRTRLPKRLAELVPRTEKDADGRWELDIDDAVDELKRCAAMGFNAVFLPVAPHPAQREYHHDEWEPFWAAAEESAMVIAFHIGTEPIDFARGGSIGVTYHGPGGAVLNYTETSFGGQRAVMKLVASGALDRHPSLKVLVSEGGATWVPFVADRMEEGYRRHAIVVRPKLSRSPLKIIYSQVYASFQHDSSAVAAVTAMGFNNVLWGSDYPHKGTFGHTQATLHQLFDVE